MKTKKEYKDWEDKFDEIVFYKDGLVKPFGQEKRIKEIKQFLLKAIKEAKCRTAEENGKFCELRLEKQRSEIIENLITELHYCIENKEDYKRVKKYLEKQK